jgi:hypothetical protein
MPICEGPQAKRLGKAKDPLIIDPKCGGDHHRSVIGHGDEPTVERGVEVWGKQKSIEDVETLAIALTVGPGLDVAGPKELCDRQSSDRAASFPVVDQPRSKDVLADALNDKPLDFGGP